MASQDFNKVIGNFTISIHFEEQNSKMKILYKNSLLYDNPLGRAKVIVPEEYKTMPLDKKEKYFDAFFKEVFF
ncbi:MAG: hypothetical protein LBJ31_10110 [Treponema sp.]|jgi:hypothetical protein|nr:hypothetical protein [Treponema sp.]